MDERKTICDMFEDIKEEMCDKYCKFPEKFDCDDEEQYEAFNEICANCPLNRL